MTTVNKITIAIDGWSSCGKSTLAKDLAKELGYIYIDSGAMYRGITLYALENNLIKNGEVQREELINKLNEIKLEFKKVEGKDTPSLFVDEKNVESKIRSGEVPKFVSKIAQIKEVRIYLVDLQREWGREGGVVMDGRDIGSVVFPNAELKLFLTAKPEIRAKRRFDELTQKSETVSLEEVKENLAMRDKMDTEREESPLIQTDDAIVIDNSELNQKEQLNVALSYAKERIL